MELTLHYNIFGLNILCKDLRFIELYFNSIFFIKFLDRFQLYNIVFWNLDLLIIWIINIFVFFRLNIFKNLDCVFHRLNIFLSLIFLRIALFEFFFVCIEREVVILIIDVWSKCFNVYLFLFNLPFSYSAYFQFIKFLYMDYARVFIILIFWFSSIWN